MKIKLLDITQEWDINISILKNPLLWFQLIVMVLISSSFLLLLLVGLNLYEYHWEDIPASFSVVSTVGGGLFIAFVLIMFMMYWRGVPTRYILRDNYIEQHTFSKGKKTVGFMGLLALLSGKSTGTTAAGASLLAHSREQIATQWTDIFKLEVFPKRREIQLSDEWHTVMQIVCPEDKFEDILHFIQKKTEKHIVLDKDDKSIETPFATKIMFSILALVFGIFLFPRLPIHFVGIFTIGVMVFSLLSLWSEGLKQRIFGGILFIHPIIGVALAFIFGEVDMSQQGAIYALLIELVLLVFYLFLGWRVVFKYIR